MAVDAIKAAYKHNEHRYIARGSPLPLIYDDLRGVRDRHAASRRYGHRTPRAGPALRHDAAAVLRGRLCDQSLDGHHQSRQQRRCTHAVAAPLRHLSAIGTHRRSSRSGARAARHGVRRQRWVDTRRHGCCRTLQIRSTPTGVSCLRGMARRTWLPTTAHSPRQRRPGRSAAGGRRHLGRVRFSNRLAGTRRDRRDLRPPGDQPRTYRSALYHLDTALTVLDDTTIAYYPPAFTYVSRAHLETLFPDALVVDSADAYVFGLNAVSKRETARSPARSREPKAANPKLPSTAPAASSAAASLPRRAQEEPPFLSCRDHVCRSKSHLRGRSRERQEIGRQ